MADTAKAHGVKMNKMIMNDFPKRTFEPPAVVYKKVEGDDGKDVILECRIPANAYVRGRGVGKCRASRAVILEGQGRSTWDVEYYYKKGDKVCIKDFDYSGRECSSGFHFFCTKEEAVAYW